MRYLLDTDHISIIQRRSGEAYQLLRSRISQHSPTDFGLCIISFHEQSLGANNVIQKANNVTQTVSGYELLEQVLQGFRQSPVIGFDSSAATLVTQLRAQGIRIGTMDLRIAAICLTQNLTLLTRNHRDFQQVPHLKFEDWTS